MLELMCMIHPRNRELPLGVTEYCIWYRGMDRHASISINLVRVLRVITSISNIYFNTSLDQLYHILLSKLRQ